MEHDPEFQRFWEAQQALAREEAERPEAARAASGRRRRNRQASPIEPSGMTDSHPDPRESAGNGQPSPQSPAGGPVYQMPWQEPAPGPGEPQPEGYGYAASDPYGQAEGYAYPDDGGYEGYGGQAGGGYEGGYEGYGENADSYGQPAPRRREPDQPRSKSYRNVDDDAFFRSFGEGDEILTAPMESEEQPVTLDDLFGGDDR